MPLLNDREVRALKPKDKPYRVADERGLYIEVVPNGSKYWRLKYRFAKKEKRLAIGVYPEVTLAGARRRRDDARMLLRNGIDPGIHKKVAKASAHEATVNGFEVIGQEWFSKYSPQWTESHASKVITRLKQDVFPWVGQSRIDQIEAPELLTVLRRVEARGAVETAHRELQYCSRIFRFAIATGRAKRNPAADLKDALTPVGPDKHHASITEPKAIGTLLRVMDGYSGTFVVKCALRLAPLVFVRPIELRKAEWSEFDLEAAGRTQHVEP